MNKNVLLLGGAGFIGGNFVLDAVGRDEVDENQIGFLLLHEILRYARVKNVALGRSLLAPAPRSKLRNVDPRLA